MALRHAPQATTAQPQPRGNFWFRALRCTSNRAKCSRLWHSHVPAPYVGLCPFDLEARSPRPSVSRRCALSADVARLSPPRGAQFWHCGYSAHTYVRSPSRRSGMATFAPHLHGGGFAGLAVQPAPAQDCPACLHGAHYAPRTGSCHAMEFSTNDRIRRLDGAKRRGLPVLPCSCAANNYPPLPPILQVRSQTSGSDPA